MCCRYTTPESRPIYRRDPTKACAGDGHFRAIRGLLIPSPFVMGSLIKKRRKRMRKKKHKKLLKKTRWQRRQQGK